MTALPGTSRVRPSSGKANLTSAYMPGNNLPSVLRDLQLGQQRPRCRIERAGGADDFRNERLVRNFAKRHSRVLVRLDRGRVSLRNGNINAQRVGLRDAEERLALTRAARGNEHAVIDSARSDDAGKRCDDLLKPLRFFEPLHVCLCGGEVRLARIGAGFFLIELLRGDDFSLQQVVPAFQRGSRQLEIRRGLLRGRASLIQFLIDLRRLDFGE